jgi:tRNA (guanine-N7-)-methyltransferase
LQKISDEGLKNGGIESEFGVPIPGRILAEGLWAKTALKKLPEGFINWQELFERDAPVVIDIGCGNGRSTLASAVDRPEVSHLGTDILPVVIRYATRRANQRGLSNTRWAVIGGRELLLKHVAAHSVAEIHCYHPQPYYRQDQVGLRLITPEFLQLVHRALIPGGRIVLQTDHPSYWAYMMNVAPVFFDFQERTSPWPSAEDGMTRREIIAKSRGLKIFRGEGIARKDLNSDDALRLAESLPLPTFNADRRLQAIDALERGDKATGRKEEGRNRFRRSGRSRGNRRK